jgi:hypothetical protein
MAFISLMRVSARDRGKLPPVLLAALKVVAPLTSSAGQNRANDTPVQMKPVDWTSKHGRRDRHQHSGMACRSSSRP